MLPEDLITFHTVRDAGRIMAIGRSRTYELIKKGKIYAVKTNGKTMIPTASLKIYSIERQVEAMEDVAANCPP